MYDLPSRSDIGQCVIDRSVVLERVAPTLVPRAEQARPSPASAGRLLNRASGSRALLSVASPQRSQSRAKGTGAVRRWQPHLAMPVAASHGWRRPEVVCDLVGDALAWLDGHQNLERMLADTRRPPPSLGRMRRLVDALGHPEQASPALHVTGTNGKTSTARCLTALLTAKGLRSGPSPAPIWSASTSGSPPTASRSATPSWPRCSPTWPGSSPCSVTGVRLDLVRDPDRGRPALVRRPTGGRGGLRGRARWPLGRHQRGRRRRGGGHQHRPRPRRVPRADPGGRRGGEGRDRQAGGDSGPRRAGPRARAHLRRGGGPPSAVAVAGGTTAAPATSSPSAAGCSTCGRPAAALRGGLAGPARRATRATTSPPPWPPPRPSSARPSTTSSSREAAATVRLPVASRSSAATRSSCSTAPRTWRAPSALRPPWRRNSASARRSLVVGMLHGKDPERCCEALGAPSARLVVACPPPSPRAQPAEAVADAAARSGWRRSPPTQSPRRCKWRSTGRGPDDLVLVTGSLYVVGAAAALASHLTAARYGRRGRLADQLGAAALSRTRYPARS